MPLLAGLIGAIASGLTGFFASMMSLQLAMKFAAYTTWIVLAAAYFASVFVFVNSLWMMASAYFSTSGGVATASGAISLGLSTIIPANAATVLACCSAVWISTQVYKLQKLAIFTFGH